MRAAGLSASKTASLRDLDARVLNDTVVVDPHRLAREPDDEVIARLSAVRGIGEWTADTSFCSSSAAWMCRRPAIWASARVGLGRPDPTPKQLSTLGEPLRPYRSVAAWDCWRAAEIYAGAAESAVTG
jgi:DNA-3-methyladenine glycosylase II